MVVKPHRGKMIEAEPYFVTPDKYVYIGRFDGHSQFHWRRGHTSMVVKDWADQPWLNGSYEVETLNSRYTIIPTEEFKKFLSSFRRQIV